jgi:uncharacterized protein involved in exopolysaccharide biosynthesis
VAAFIGERTPYPAIDRKNQMSKRDIILFLFKWKYSLIGYLVFVVAAVTLFVYLMPQKYEADASVLVEANRAPLMRSDLVPASSTDELSALNSEIAIIQSRTVLAAAVDKVGPGGDQEPPSSIELMLNALSDWMVKVGLKEYMTDRESRIRGLSDDLDVEPVPNSSVISISLKGKSPKLTAALVNAVTESYIAQHLKVYSAAGTPELMRQQLDRLGRELEGRRNALKIYKQQTSVLAMADMQSSLVGLQSELTLKINSARDNLAELQTRYGPKHTKVVLAKQQLAELQAEQERTAQKLQNLESQVGRIREMELGITTLEKSYQDYQKRYEEGRLDSQANPQMVNVRVIEYASVPTRAKHSRIFFILLAVAGGVLLSVGIALTREYFDHRVTDPDTVAQILGVPTLGSIEHA